MELSEATASDNRIELEQFYPHPIGDVWSAISEADRISAWFIEADFSAQVGFNYTFKHKSTTITGEVLEVNPPERLVYTWIVGDSDVETLVSWTLKTHEGGTVLRIEHTGFESYADTAAEMIKSTTSGWSSVASGLMKYLEQHSDG